MAWLRCWKAPIAAGLNVAVAQRAPQPLDSVDEYLADAGLFKSYLGFNLFLIKQPLTSLASLL